ncbi:hypothetical protein SAMN06295879_0145 [Agreia bicolorata]|uniref:Uncharacterized protein n=1 Tax=Agreia bicolorata TaxID=110935 RepID=A0A1T4WS65_9MICO|nr:hypothetical protein TZ00_07160 [Agreia bicolorata]SKA79957.1 hypothetical protein SAMN06295879_0145 [Agreia bicolorata]
MHDVPASIRCLLLSALEAESKAVGPEVRDAVRTTHYLLAGCRDAGVSVASIADVVQVRAESIRLRSVDGVLSVAVFARLAGVTVDEVSMWQRDGLLPTATPDALKRTGYPASALVAGLLATSEGGDASCLHPKRSL